MRKLFHAAAAFLVTALVAAPVKADPVALDQWYTFGFGGTGSSLISGAGFVLGTNPPSIAAPDPAWTFTVIDPVELILLDGFAAGDQFSIFNFGALLGNTSAPTDDGTNCGSDITACLAEDAISKATFLLGAGSYSITGTVIANATGHSSGAGFFQISSAITAVPEPASLGLFGAALAGVALLRRKRRTA